MMRAVGVCWPNARQEQLLAACFAAAPIAEPAARAWLAFPSVDDDTSRRLLPQLRRRWPALVEQAGIATLATRVGLTMWRQNAERLSQLGTIAAHLESHGIPALVLKGAALLLDAYPDHSLRTMGDVDILVHQVHTRRALTLLAKTGWRAEDGSHTTALESQSALVHGCQLVRDVDEHCDLHWRPIARCHQAAVAARFWTHARWARLGDAQLRIPSRTEMLFHVCAHGLQWHWTSQLRWIQDSMTILSASTPIDWERLRALAVDAGLVMRLDAALSYLRTAFGAPVPCLSRTATRWPASWWERRLVSIAQQPIPLSAGHSLLWHLDSFERLRRGNIYWRRRNRVAAFADYLALTYGLPSRHELPRALGVRALRKLRRRS